MIKKYGNLRLLNKITILSFLISSFVFATPRTNVKTQNLIDQLKLKSTNSIQSQLDIEFSKIPYLEKEKQIYLPFVGVLKDEFIDNHDLSDQFKIGSQTGKVITIYAKPNQISILLRHEALDILKISEKVNQPNVDDARQDSRVNRVHLGDQLPQAYTGKGVLLGIIDGGFDYTHPNFYDDNLDKYRVAAAWDQRTPGNPPEGFEFGSVYETKEALLQAKRDSDDIEVLWGTHGTHVAGIAGGTGVGTAYRGVAYEADFLFCTRRDDEAGNYDAYNWMAKKAKELGKRLVINMSYGGIHRGTHDGTSEVGLVITELVDQGVVFVGSAGNNGSGNFHLSQQFDSDTVKTFIDKARGGFWGNRIVMIGEQEKDFNISVQARNLTLSNQIDAESRVYSTSTELAEIDTFLIAGQDTVFYRIEVEDSDPFSGRPRIDLSIKFSNRNDVVLKAFADEGTVHFWNVGERSDRTSNRGFSFASLPNVEDLVRGDNKYSLGEPGSNTDVITCAAHSHYTGQLAGFSSEGPRLDGLIKPDISAPGVSVISSIASFEIADNPQDAVVEFEDTYYTFGGLSGTSMSAPMTAGVCALILEARPDLSPRELKTLLKATAYSDEFTGEIPEGFSTEWGAGKVSAVEAIENVLIDVENDLVLYPNPTENIINIKGSLYEFNYIIFDLNGRIQSQGSAYDRIILPNLALGSYYISINNQDPIKFVKN